ncbi:MBL fold metallo-hydrolase [Nibribacter ruber]|uniref:MBL fold metallo-hydrolase n=1 Tax=Nibribacter ruber TaxID=2698458 RepID=A0A6P1NW02_9BACT|nr:MBL fold metallo-hydrolase [Nibribacter ruber]QHL85955.1 MBL fold metallo-hydrolase [Nibribacter ruber]
MGVYFTSLNSGSNGNCYYVGNDQEAVLIDAGISCRETEKRMLRLGLSMSRVKAIFVSHEHSDHIRGVAVLARKHRIPVYITPATLHNCYLRTEAIDTLPFEAGEAVQIGGLTITAFAKYHDAADPHSFVVSAGEFKVGVFTDLGRTCQNLMEHFSQCHAAFLEANYDEHLLENGRYPYYLKNRIRGGHGHLSNREALTLFSTCKPDHMSHVLLSHLSKENNCPNLVKELFQAHAGDTQVVVASRYEESPVFTLLPQEAMA